VQLTGSTSSIRRDIVMPGSAYSYTGVCKHAMLTRQCGFVTPVLDCGSLQTM